MRYFNYVLALLAILGISQIAAGDHGKGLKIVSKAEIQKFEKNHAKILRIKANKIGSHRINQHLYENGKPGQDIEIAHHHSDEIITNEGLTSKQIEEETRALLDQPLPRSVNNTLLHSFPPIGDQQQLGSCVAWGSTYYLATHEYGLLNGIDNKANSTSILSPKWTYNLLNGGQDEGLNIPDAFKLLAQSGAPSITSFPYDANYLAWDLNPNDWVSALSFRLNGPYYIGGLDGSEPQSLQALKQLLNNGHIVSIGTFIESWVMTKVGNDPSAPSPYAGQDAAAWMNGTEGGHCMTIVGYDDDIWIDINGNGVVDPGEKGAFLIANQWGSDWGNNGLVWVSYDALLASSAVKNGPKNGRVPLLDGMNSNVITMVPKSPHYSPKLIAQFTVSCASRMQLSAGSGVSDTSHSTPQQSIAWFALQNQGGNYAFNGKSTKKPVKATFAFDLTDLLPAKSANQRYYLTLHDKYQGKPTTLSAYTLIDTIHNKSINYSPLPITFDGITAIKYLTYNFVDTAKSDDTLPIVQIVAPKEQEKIKGLVGIVAHASGNNPISHVDFYLDSQMIFSDDTNPYFLSWDSKSVQNGPHQLTVIAYDSANHTSENTITVNVKN